MIAVRSDAASMILTCPICATRFRVADEEFADAAGRTVRCGNCGHVWRETPPASQPPGRPESSVEAASWLDTARADPVTHTDPPPAVAQLEVPRIEVPPRSPPIEPQKPQYSRSIVAVALLLLAAVGALFVHHELASSSPSPRRLSAVAGETNAPSGTGLVIRKIEPARTAGGLTIDGEIANLGSVAHDVPRLRVALQDAAEKIIQSEIVDPPKPRLLPGEIVHFETPFAHPPDDATGVVVTFASS
jgi:predicted Zn finger-like uncharacterized protein